MGMWKVLLLLAFRGLRRWGGEGGGEERKLWKRLVFLEGCKCSQSVSYGFIEWTHG